MSVGVRSIAGSLLGTMVGESIGMVVDGLERGQLRHRYADAEAILGAAPLRYGAATEMTMAMAESLAAAPDFDAADFAHRLVDGATDRRGYGRGTTAALEALRAGADWRDAAAGHGARTSFGNGAATRAAPAGLLWADDMEMLRWVAEEAAAVTHQHALSSEGAVLQATAAALAGASAGGSLSPADYLLSVGAETESREFRERYQHAARAVERDVDDKRIVDRLGTSTAALGSVATAAYCFARHADSFTDAVSHAIRLAGNTAAIAAMVGALSGAHLGAAAIPAAWVEAVAADAIDRARIERVAAELARARPSASDE